MNITLANFSDSFNVSSPWKAPSNCCNCCSGMKERLRLNFDKPNFVIVEKVTQSRFQRFFSSCTNSCKQSPYTIKSCKYFHINNWNSIEKKALGNLLNEERDAPLSEAYKLLKQQIINVNRVKVQQTYEDSSAFFMQHISHPDTEGDEQHPVVSKELGSAGSFHVHWKDLEEGKHSQLTSISEEP